MVKTNRIELHAMSFNEESALLSLCNRHHGLITNSLGDQPTIPQAFQNMAHLALTNLNSMYSTIQIDRQPTQLSYMYCTL